MADRVYKDIADTGNRHKTCFRFCVTTGYYLVFYFHTFFDLKFIYFIINVVSHCLDKKRLTCR